MASCYRYTSVRLSNPVTVKKAGEGGKSGTVLPPAGGNSGKKFIFYKHKQFCRIFSFSPLAKINNSAVDFALEGRLPESEILLLDLIRESSEEAAAYNNLGVIYEIAGNSKAAFDMYSKACLLEPGNQVFRGNFLSFVEAQHDIIILEGAKKKD